MLVGPEIGYGRALAYIVSSQTNVWDLETDGLRPYHGNRIVGVAALPDAGPPMYFPFRHRRGANQPLRHLESLLNTLATPGKILIGHNSVRFDGPMAAQDSSDALRNLVMSGAVQHEDTIIDALLANENEPSFSLDSLGKKYLGDAALKEQRKGALLASLRAQHPRVRSPRSLMGHMADLTPEEVEPYACGDVLDTRALRDLYRPHLELWGLTALRQEMFGYARLLARIERTGLAVDSELCAERAAACRQAQAGLLTELRASLGSKFNPNSSPQVCSVLGTPDATKEMLRESTHPLAQKVIGYKRLGKMAGTYYQAILDLRDSDGIIHPQMNLSRDPRDLGGTRSCRLSCSNPNFQNLPARSDEWYMQVRDVVISRPGKTLIKLDYERAEMWLGAHYSGDPALYEAYHEGRNLYKELAVNTGLDPEKDYTKAKITWLAIQYGAGGAKLAQMHGWPHVPIGELELQFGKEIHQWRDPEWRVYMAQQGPKTKKGFFQLCPGIKDQMRELEEEARERGSIRLWTGRAIHFDEKYTFPFSAWNRKIQGGVAEMIRVAMQRLEEPLEYYGADILLQVHDELVLEAPDEAVHDVVRLAQSVMTDFDFWLKPRVEITVGKRYSKTMRWDG